MIPATPTAAAFLRSLPRDKATALEMVDGALAADVADPQWSAEERQEVTFAKLRLSAAKQGKKR